MLERLMDINLQAGSEIYKSDITQMENISKKDIAVIGISGKFAGASNISEYWECLLQGKDYICEFPEQRRNDNRTYLKKIQSMGKIGRAHV